MLEGWNDLIPTFQPSNASRLGAVMGFPHKPHPKETVVLSQYFGDADARTYKGWTKRGGYAALSQVLKMDPVAVTDIVKESGLRGDRKSTRLNSSHLGISYAVFCL